MRGTACAAPRCFFWAQTLPYRHSTSGGRPWCRVGGLRRFHIELLPWIPLEKSARRGTEHKTMRCSIATPCPTLRQRHICMQQVRSEGVVRTSPASGAHFGVRSAPTQCYRSPHPHFRGGCAYAPCRRMVKPRMRRTLFAGPENGRIETDGWIECAGGIRTDRGSHRQRIGENASNGDALHGEVATDCERRHQGRKPRNNSRPIDRPPQRPTPSTALRNGWHGSLLPTGHRATSMP